MKTAFTDDILQHRKPEYDIEPLILSRWSPRSMTGEPLTDEELMPVFEAAKWAPSAYNGQHWRFLYAKRETEHWNAFFDVLVDFNKSWCKNAAVLVLIISKKTFEHNGQPAKTHSFDTGAAWENLALEGTRRGFVVHAMSGFNYEQARDALDIPEDYHIECMVAIGKKGKKEDLPPEMQEKEVPSERKLLKELVTEGKFSE